MHKIIVTGDGSCSGNPGPGGWAVHVETSDGRVFKEAGGCYDTTTNNRMELQALIEGVKLALKICPECEIQVYSDSRYAVRTINTGWARNKNKDLWDEIDKLVSDKITWSHIPRNSTVAHRDCDRRAKIETKKVRYAKKEKEKEDE